MSNKKLFLLQVDFPFLVLLVSGGHCLLAIAHSVEEFHRLGESIDLAPGDALDKVSNTLFGKPNQLFFLPSMSDKNI